MHCRFARESDTLTISNCEYNLNTAAPLYVYYDWEIIMVEINTFLF